MMYRLFIALIVTVLLATGCSKAPEQEIAEINELIKMNNTMDASIRLEEFLEKSPEHEMAPFARYLYMNLLFRAGNYGEAGTMAEVILENTDITDFNNENMHRNAKDVLKQSLIKNKDFEKALSMAMEEITALREEIDLSEKKDEQQQLIQKYYALYEGMATTIHAKFQDMVPVTDYDETIRLFDDNMNAQKELSKTSDDPILKGAAAKYYKALYLLRSNMFYLQAAQMVKEEKNAEGYAYLSKHMNDLKRISLSATPEAVYAKQLIANLQVPEMELYAKAGFYKEILAMYESYKKQMPPNPGISKMNNLALGIYLKEDKPEKAVKEIEWLTRCQGVVKNEAYWKYNIIANYYKSKEDTETAYEYIDKIIAWMESELGKEENPVDMNAILTIEMGDAMYQKDDFDAARKYYEMIATEYPDSSVLSTGVIEKKLKALEYHEKKNAK